MKHNNFYDVVKSHPILVLLIGCQLFVIIYINLFCLDRYIGFDCSTYYLQAMEMWKQKTFFPLNWEFQTTLLWDSPVTLAVPLYGLINNIFTAYGIANIIVCGLLTIALWNLQKELGCSTRSKLIFLLLFFSPYYTATNSANNLGYFSMIFTSMSAYSVKLLIVILLWQTFLILDREGIKRKGAILSCVSLSLCAFSGASSGCYILIMGVAPVVLFYIVRGLLDNRWLTRDLSALFFILLGGLLNLTGKFVVKHLIGFSAKDSMAIWTSLDRFWNNLFSIIGGYFQLTGALPSSGDVQILTVHGIHYSFRLVVSLLILITGIIMAFSGLSGKRGIGNQLIAWALIGHLLIFVFSYTTYGSLIFEDRYLIIIFIILCTFCAQWIDHTIVKENASISFALKVGFVTCVAFCNILSYIFVYLSQNQYLIMQEIISQVSGKATPIVYVGGDEMNIIGRNLRVLDESKIYKYSTDMKTPYHWGDYTYYDVNSEYSGLTLLLCSEPFFSTLPEYLTSQYMLFHKVEGTNIGIYESQQNSIDFGVSSN